MENIYLLYFEMNKKGKDVMCCIYLILYLIVNFIIGKKIIYDMSFWFLLFVIFKVFL